MIAGLSSIALLLSGCGARKQAQGYRYHTQTKLAAVNWRKPSEKRPYPKLSLHRRTRDWLLVSIKKQRVYVMSPRDRVLYTMYASTGAHNGTPRGTYHIQAQRGRYFYSRKCREGARYWTSWKDHGVYLFHSVPTNVRGQYKQKVANQLGRKANSHGCVHLSIPDAHWVNQHVPTGTKVVIK